VTAVYVAANADAIGEVRFLLAWEGPAELVGSDLVLLMLAAPTKVLTAQGRVNGVTRLEKLLYLADRETDVSASVLDERLVFKAYDYGPFSKEVYEAAEILEEAGLVREERQVSGQSVDGLEDVEVTGAVEDDEYVTRCFVITPHGEAVAGLLAGQHPDVVRALSGIKDRYASRPLASLIQYVYRAYPESAVNSKIRDRVL
jgi:hypothetical protein